MPDQKSNANLYPLITLNDKSGSCRRKRSFRMVFLIPIRRGLSSVWARSVEGTPARRKYANPGHIEPIHENGGKALRVGQGLLVLWRHPAPWFLRSG
jgi:hypothetical protein